MKNYQQSFDLFQRATKSLAGGVSSQFRAFEVPHPLFYSHAAGTRIWDVDGNEYLDFALSQGPMFLGHTPPAVVQAVSEANARGQIYAGQHLAELELAEALQRMIPCAERMRFCVSGSEAVQAALRLARVYTGRTKFIKFEGHYHGWLDSVAFGINPPLNSAAKLTEDGCCLEPWPWTGGISPAAAGEAIVLPWNDLDRLRQALDLHGDEIAAVITEPIMCNNGCILPEPGFLEGMREETAKAGVVLIFDEIITGFRVAAGGAQSYFKVTPELAVFGKAMASGFPISAVTGSKRIMNLLAEGKTVQAGTMNAQAASVAAALATVGEIEKHAGQIYPRLYRQAESLRDSLAAAAREHGHAVLLQGLGPVFHLGFTCASKIVNYREMKQYDTEKYGRFCRAMKDRGVRLIGRGLWYLSAAHTEEDLEQAVAAARESFAAVSIEERGGR